MSEDGVLKGCARIFESFYAKYKCPGPVFSLVNMDFEKQCAVRIVLMHLFLLEDSSVSKSISPAVISECFLKGGK